MVLAREEGSNNLIIYAKVYGDESQPSLFEGAGGAVVEIVVGIDSVTHHEVVFAKKGAAAAATVGRPVPPPSLTHPPLTPQLPLHQQVSNQSLANNRPRRVESGGAWNAAAQAKMAKARDAAEMVKSAGPPPPELPQVAPPLAPGCPTFAPSCPTFSPGVAPFLPQMATSMASVSTRKACSGPVFPAYLPPPHSSPRCPTPSSGRPATSPGCPTLLPVLPHSSPRRRPQCKLASA